MVRPYIGILATMGFLAALVSCASQPIDGVRLLYCQENPSDPDCPSVVAKAEREGVVVTEEDRRLMAEIRAQRTEGEERNRQWVSENIRYGTITGMEVFDRSTSTGGAFANAGAAMASTSYIDRSFSGSNPTYSARGHYGAALGGALLGSLLDTTQSRFVVVYTVAYENGAVAQEAREYGFRPALIPIGTCVGVLPNGVKPVNQNLCGRS